MTRICHAMTWSCPSQANFTSDINAKMTDDRPQFGMWAERYMSDLFFEWDVRFSRGQIMYLNQVYIFGGITKKSQ